VAAVKEMKWMILGGEGQLGRAMSLKLQMDHVEFISLGHSQFDVTSQGDVEKWFKRESPDVVVNAAAWTNVDSAESNEENALLINSYGPKLLAEACYKSGSRLVQISTDYVFSGTSVLPWTETEDTSPISGYGRTKAAGELQVLEIYPGGSFIVRTAWLYSPWGKNFVKTMLRIALNESRNIEVVNDQIGQPTSAFDLSMQIQALINSDLTPGIYHGTNSGQASWFDFAREIFELIGEDQERVIGVNSEAVSRLAKRPSYSVLGHDQWVSGGIRPMRNWREALKDALPKILHTIKQGE
jgi:dTDP-4-dehydrorhamnose reductase